MANELTADIVIIGGGLTGLVTAYYLSKSEKKVFILEKENRCGGVINSVNEDGFIYESGPNSGVLSTLEAVELFEDLKDFCTLELANKNAKKRLIWKNSSWQPLPSGLSSAISTPLFNLKDKFKILVEPFRQKGNNPDESIADLVKRRLGNSFLDYAIDPFISGIYAGDPNKIITKYALPKLYNLEQEYGSFIKGAISKKKNPDINTKKVSREVFSTENGLNSLINGLTKSIGDNQIILNSSKISITPLEKSFKTKFKNNLDEFEIISKKVITTIGAYAITEILPFIPSYDLNDICSLEYAKVVQVILGFKKWNGISLDAFGGLVPSVEKRKILGVLFSSTLFKNRSNENGALLSIFMGGIKNPNAINMSDEEIIKNVQFEMKEMMCLNNFNPDLLKIFRYNHAIPQYEISTGKRLHKISEIESNYPGLILAGNIRDGIGMSDRIKQAKTIANSL